MFAASAILYVGIRRGLGLFSDPLMAFFPLSAGDGVAGGLFVSDIVTLSTPLVHGSFLSAFGDGVPVTDAASSSDDCFVCENMGSTVLFAIPKPSTLAAAASCCRTMLFGSVDVDAGMLKSSTDSVIFPPSSTPFTAEVAAFAVTIGPFHSGCGILPMIPNLPVPAFAQPQIPREGDVISSFTSTISDFDGGVDPTSLAELTWGWGDMAFEFGRGSAGAGCDSSIDSSGSAAFGLCRCFLGGVARRSLSRWSVGLGGLAVACSVDVSTVEEAGLVRRRRRGPTLLASSCRRACRGGGGGFGRRGDGWRGRLGGPELLEGADLADLGSRRRAEALRARVNECYYALPSTNRHVRVDALHRRESGRLEQCWWCCVRSWALFTLLGPALALDMTVGTGFMVVVFALVAGVGWVVKQHAARAVLDGLDHFYGKVGVALEALAVGFDVALARRVHDLARRDARHEAAEGRPDGALAVDVVDLIGVGHKLGLVEAFAILVHGDVLELGHIETVAEQVELVAADGIVVLLVRICHISDIVELALVKPFDEQLKAGRVVVWQLETVLLLLAVAVQLGLEALRVVAQKVAVEGPVAPGGADIDV
jgi:hypothetical protein